MLVFFVFLLKPKNNIMQNLKQIEEKINVSTYLIDENNCVNGNTQVAKQSGERAPMSETLKQNDSQKQNSINVISENEDDDFELDDEELMELLFLLKKETSNKSKSNNNTMSVPRIGGKSVYVS